MTDANDGRVGVCGATLLGDSNENFSESIQRLFEVTYLTINSNSTAVSMWYFGTITPLFFILPRATAHWEDHCAAV